MCKQQLHWIRGVLEDAQAALVELSSHIHHRTNLLGNVLHSVRGGTHKLQESCVALASQVAQMNKVLMEQRDPLELLKRAHPQHLHEIQEVRHCNQEHAWNIRSSQRNVLVCIRNTVPTSALPVTNRTAGYRAGRKSPAGGNVVCKAGVLGDMGSSARGEQYRVEKSTRDQKTRADEHETICMLENLRDQQKNPY